MTTSPIAPTCIDEQISVRRARFDDIDELSTTLAAAFFDDPVFQWCFPDADRRRRILRPWFEAVVRSYLVHDHTFTTDDTVAGALWLPDGADDDEHLEVELAEASCEYSDRLAMIFERLSAHHPTQPHHYLFLLATRPDHQSRGIGSTLLRTMLDTCDRDGTDAYLEATSEGNRKLYVNHGFEVIGEIRLPDGPSLWPMWRESRPASDRPRKLG